MPYMKLFERVKLLILDVDGIMTDGKLYYGDNNFEMKGFCIHDGLGIKLLQRSGVPVAIISGKSSAAVIRRTHELGINSVYLGQSDKLPAFNDLMRKFKLHTKEIAYMGDDLPDLPILKSVGLGITVPQALTIIKNHSHYVTSKPGGAGAIREVCELIMQANGTYESIIEPYTRSITHDSQTYVD